MDTAAFPCDDMLVSLPLFQGVGLTEVQRLVTAARLVHYDKGSVFLAQGQHVTRCFIMIEGWCGASKGNIQGQETILQIFGRGDFLPEPDKITMAEPSIVNFQTLTPVQLISLPPAIVQETLERSSIFMANMLTASARRTQELRDHIEQLTLHNAEERVGRFLLQIRFNCSADGKDIMLPFDKALIAAYLGIKPETFSRALQAFREKGFVIDRNRLIVPDREALCEYCDQVAMRSCQFAHTDTCVNSSHGDADL